MTTHQSLKHQPLTALRHVIRDGHYTAHTAGLGAGYLQANLAIMPQRYALDFMRFCQRNPKPCPMVAVSDTGNPQLHTLGSGIDIRSDVPAYNIYRYGECAASTNNINDLWQDDFVAFALGCSFTFEHALERQGFALWHIDNNTTVPMYRSNIDTLRAGPFSGKMVVSMRAVNPERIDDVIAISRRYPLAHGGPVHWGDPAAIGIDDINRPEWGDAAPVDNGQIPVFWACGVTPQVAIENAQLPICITHKPGCMLITDIPEDAEIPVIADLQSPTIKLGETT